MPFAYNGTLKLAYEQRGRGAPILLIMGYAARAAHWGEDFRNLLAARHTVVSFDNRGTGDSDKLAQEWTMGDMAQDALAVMFDAGMSAAHVVGVSMGGMIAQEMALSYPENLQTLTLVSTHCGGHHVTPPTQAAADALMRPDRSQPVRRTLERIWRTICAPGFLDTPDRLEACLKLDLEKPTPVPMLLNQLKAIQASDRSTRLGSIHAPTLVITGTDDPLVPPENSQRLTALIPGARLVRITDCGHMVPLEKPGELAAAVMEFIAIQDRQGL